jgi:hypothetical protein
MDQKAICLAVAPSAGAIAVGYWLTSAASIRVMVHPLALGLFAVSIIWPVALWVTLDRDVFAIEEWPVPNALNFRITNKRVKAGMVDDVLILHSVKIWNPGRRQFQTTELRAINGTPPKILPLRLTHDRPELPYQVPRMFQLVQFTDWNAPFIQGYIVSESDMRLAKIPLPHRGVWQFDMELRWAGGSRPVTRCFEWGENSLPTFCQCPS